MPYALYVCLQDEDRIVVFIRGATTGQFQVEPATRLTPPALTVQTARGGGALLGIGAGYVQAVSEILLSFPGHLQYIIPPMILARPHTTMEGVSPSPVEGRA
jgi:hypothetical protein